MLAKALVGTADLEPGSLELPTGPDQIGLLQGRARVYSALGELLYGRPGHSHEEARAMLAGSSYCSREGGPLAELRAALAATTAGAIDAEIHDLPESALRCSDARASVRSWACVAAEVAPDETRATDLAVLGALADDLAWKVRLDNARLAAAIQGCRHQFLRAHAARCLLGAARGLEAAGTPIVVAAARALRHLLESEPHLEPWASPHPVHAGG